MNRLVAWRYEFAIIAAWFFGSDFELTTPLTIYGFGLRGNSAYKSIGKHRFRTKKHQKVNKSSQKTMAYLFGYWRPGVRISTLRPKKRKRTLVVLFLFFRWCGWWKLHFCIAERSAHTPRRRVKLACKRQVRVSSPTANTSTRKEPLRFSFCG